MQLEVLLKHLYLEIGIKIVGLNNKPFCCEAGTEGQENIQTHELRGESSWKLLNRW